MHTLGFTFDEKILNDLSLEEFFYDFPSVDAIELAADESLLPLRTYKKIARYAPNQHYHVPYFVQPMKFDFSSNTYQKDYTKFLSIIESLRQYSVKRPSIIIHGANVKKDRVQAFEQTKSGLDFLLNFIVKKNIDVQLNIETIQSHGIGSQEEIKQLIHMFSSDQLKACLDIYHVRMNKETVDDDFLKLVDYVHLHDHHGSIQKLDNHWLKKIPTHMNLELLYDFCQNYRQDLISDIHTIRNIGS